MNRKKIIFMGLLGAVFFLAGIYLRIINPEKSDISFEYLGIGTWIAGVLLILKTADNKIYISCKIFESIIGTLGVYNDSNRIYYR